MKLHLYCILPASLLVCLQFVPIIRYRLILFHRMNGYVVIILSLVSSAGTIIICRRAFGGDFATQTWAGATVILTTIGYIMAWINIKLLQIDQHRAWMMRTWVWVSCLLLYKIVPFAVGWAKLFKHITDLPTVLDDRHHSPYNDNLVPDNQH